MPSLSSPHPLPLLLTAILVFAAPTLEAQDAASAGGARDAALSLETLEKRLEETLSDSTMSQNEKASGTKNFEAAIANLRAASGFEAETASWKEAFERGPAELAAIRSELDKRRQGEPPSLGADSPELPSDATAEMIAARATSEKARLSEFTRQVRDRDAELSELQSRPSEIRERIIEVTRLLTETESQLAKHSGDAAPSPSLASELARDQTRLRMLRAELAMLEQESLSSDLRRELVQARRDLAASDLALTRERVAQLESRSGALVSARISLAERLVEDLGLPAREDDPDLRRLFEESRELALKNQALLSRIASADAARNRAEEELERLRRESQYIRAQIEIGGLENTFSEILVDLRRTLPTAQSLRGAMTERRRATSEARLEAFRTERELATFSSPDGQVEELLDLLRTKGVDENDLNTLRPGFSEFVANRTKLRQDLIEGNRRLATLLGETDFVMIETLNVSGDLGDFLGERLLWTASSPPLGKNAFTGLRTALLALFGPEALLAYGRAVARIGSGKWVLAGLFAFVLLAPRRRLRLRLAESGARTRRISADSIGNTLGALAISLWLALPIPALLGFFGWVFSSDPLGTGAVYALGQGLIAPALLLLVLLFSTALCLPGGVADAHFRWRRPLLDPMQGALKAMMVLYAPAHLLLAIWWSNGENLSAFQGPGRLVFIAAMIAVALILRHLFQGRDGILPQLDPKRSKILKMRRFWSVAIVAPPIALAMLAGGGHFLTAVALAYLLQKTGFVIFGSILAYALLTRWAMLSSRRMALAEALAQREAKRAAQETVADGSGSPAAEAPARDESFIPLEEEEPVDWAVVGEQTHHLIRAVVVLLALFGCWIAWSEALPVLKFLDSRNLVGEVSFGDLIWLAIIGTITLVVFQNLPGLLELVFLRALEVESGVRNAIITLCQYLVIAIGAAAAFQTLGLDWSRFGWIAAALSVGLGFGLQEVVANFVSGLILLFERPIRVGDVVTVAGVDGVVTKIRIRATTITTWDKKEFIVPNKEFVTGTIMNWTLSNAVTRLVFPVGIAYGSDIKKAREILLDIARSQPEILADPAPAAIFDQFADSSLNFTLRCFLASTDQRLEMTHRINTLIHDRFAEAGIEIPFPQRELHLHPSKAGTMPDDFAGVSSES